MHVNEIEVDIEFRFHCPMTGEIITAPDHYGPSPATAFLLGPGADEFDYLAPDLRPICEEVCDARGEAERSPWRLFEEFCARLAGHDHLVLFSLTSSGIACGPVRSTVHVCIDFGYLAGETSDEADDSADHEEDGDDGDDESVAAAVPLPRHLPSAVFGTLLAAYQRVAQDVSDEPDYGPIDLLVGYRDLAAGQGFMAMEYDAGEGESPCGPPWERMRRGERLAIQLHDGWLADGVRLIDGRRYRPTSDEIRANEALEAAVEPGHPRVMPDDTGFYALGIGLVGDRLSIEPIAVDCGMHGESLVRPVVFPESLRRRIAAYLAGLA